MIGYLRNHLLEATSGLLTDCSLYDEVTYMKKCKKEKKKVKGKSLRLHQVGCKDSGTNDLCPVGRHKEMCDN